MTREMTSNYSRFVQLRCLFLLVLSGGLLFLGACGSAGEGSGATSSSELPDQLRPIAWEAFGQPAGREIRIIAYPEYCVGTPKPRIPVVHVAEEGRRVVVTAMVTVNRARQTVCDAVGYAVRSKIRLARPLGERKVYDAVTSPARLRWPRADVGRSDP